MQDRFRFRAWNTCTKIMKEVSQISFDDKQIAEHAPKDKVSVHLNFQPHFILMQCIGLKDKYGKLIFEKDIVVDNERDKAIIEYNNLHACFQFNFGDDYREFGESDVDIEQCEIIGNIYENPELLE